MSIMHQLVSVNALKHKYPGIDEEECIYANLPGGLNGKVYDLRTYPEVEKIWENEIKDRIDSAKRTAFEEGMKSQESLTLKAIEEIDKLKSDIDNTYDDGFNNGLDECWKYLIKLINMHEYDRERTFKATAVEYIIKHCSCKDVIYKIHEFEYGKESIKEKLKAIVDESGTETVFDCLYEITHPELYATPDQEDSKDE